MDVIRVMIVHQDPSTRARLRHLLDQELDLDLVEESASTVNAVPFIRECQPQLVFLQAPFKAAPTLSRPELISEASPTLIVFVSAHNAYAVHAFEASALDYLQEPFTDARFTQTLTRARERLREHQIIANSGRLLHVLQHYLNADTAPSVRPSSTPYGERLVVKTGSRLIFLDTNEVDRIESEGVYVRLHVGATSYLLRESLQNVELRLRTRQFIRIHRSTMVNAQRIKEIVPHTNGGAIVILRDGARLKLSRSYRNRVNAMLG